MGDVVGTAGRRGAVIRNASTAFAHPAASPPNPDFGEPSPRYIPDGQAWRDVCFVEDKSRNAQLR
jgi:hypothetical protein